MRFGIRQRDRFLSILKASLEPAPDGRDYIGLASDAFPRSVLIISALLATSFLCATRSSSGFAVLEMTPMNSPRPDLDRSNGDLLENTCGAAADRVYQVLGIVSDQSRWWAGGSRRPGVRRQKKTSAP